MIMDTNKTNDLYLSHVLYLSETKIFCRKEKSTKKCMLIGCISIVVRYNAVIAFSFLKNRIMALNRLEFIEIFGNPISGKVPLHCTAFSTSIEKKYPTKYFDFEKSFHENFRLQTFHVRLHCNEMVTGITLTGPLMSEPAKFPIK